MSKLGICIAGLNGAVGSTLVAGVALMRRGLAPTRAVISEAFVARHQLAGLDEIVFGGWDPRGEDVHTAALRHAVLEPHRLAPVAREFRSLKPFPSPGGRRSLGASVTSLARDLDRFRRRHRLDRVVLVNLLPTGAHDASRAYAAAANAAGCPLANFTPNDCGEDRLTAIPFAGRDGKTGQTWFKSVLAPALRDRGLRITGWYSTNLLGNEDGKVVGDPVKGRAKIRDKTKLLAAMVDDEPFHLVQINYYPPRGDNKESWDNIDFEGFLGMPMQIKVNQLLRDSILAAPMCLDLARFLALAQRRGDRGPQEWLSYFFKAPYSRTPRTPPPHDAAKQEGMLAGYLNRG